MTQPPYPYSDYITSLTWDSLGNVETLGYESDSWPITWHDDGDLYTTYCDGSGFDDLGTDYSLGFASISGASVAAWSGTNISSTDAVPTGFGETGRKSSGILSISGVLYLWVRNADGNGKTCELWSSSDDGVNWTDHFTFSEFGYLTFINYGQDYADAIDTYVYAFSHNSNDAYSPANDFVLLRCPKTGLTTSGNWEVYTGLSGSTPQWSTTFSNRASVFYNPGGCLRSRCTYNADIERFLWWQQIPSTDGSPPDTRTSGGFGVYDAENPWGPWTTAYYTETWDMGPGEAAEFPTKFMSNGGKTMWLLSSSNDELTARQATITLADSPTELDVLPAASADDAEEDSGGVVSITGAGLDLGQNAYVGIRYQLNIPKDATVLRASIRFKSRGNYQDACSQTIQCEAADDAAQFTTTTDSISDRNKTGAVTWSDVPTWYTDEYFWSGDFAAAVQEVVNRANWTQNDYIVVLFGGLSGRRSAHSYDSSTTDAPMLHVSYSTGTTVSAQARLWADGWHAAAGGTGVELYASAILRGDAWHLGAAATTTALTAGASMWGDAWATVTPQQITYLQAAAILRGDGWHLGTAQARNIKPYYSAGVPFVVGKVEY